MIETRPAWRPSRRPVPGAPEAVAATQLAGPLPAGAPRRARAVGARVATVIADTAAMPTQDHSPASPRIRDYATLLASARDPADELTLAFAGVIGQALASGQRPLIRGLPAADFRRLLDGFFPGADLTNGDAAADPAAADELSDLLALLLEFRREPSEPLTWLSHAVASAAMRDNHLWQDMGLPNRAFLSALMAHQFPGLAALNSGDMKWKKFFYRQLCERAEVPICKSPNCEQCVDYRACFTHAAGDT